MFYARNHGKHYSQEEIDLIFRTRNTERNRRRLAALLGRTEDAIDFVYRWNDPSAGFPLKAFNRIRRQFAAARARLGEGAEGSVDLN